MRRPVAEYTKARVGIGQARVRPGIERIASDRLLEVLGGLDGAVAAGTSPPDRSTSQIPIESRRVRCLMPERCAVARRSELDAKHADDRARNFFLNSEDVRELAIICLRPHDRRIVRAHELRRSLEATPLAPHASLE